MLNKIIYIYTKKYPLLYINSTRKFSDINNKNDKKSFNPFNTRQQPKSLFIKKTSREK